MGLAALAFVTVQPALFAAYVTVGALVGALHLPVLARTSREQIIVGSVLVVATCSLLAVNVFRYPTTLAHFVITAVAVVSALVVTGDPVRYRKASLVTLVTAQVALLLYAAWVGLDKAPTPLEGIFPTASTNAITSCLVVLQLNYCVAGFFVRNRPPLLTPLLTFAICVIGYGRGSIVIAAAIVIVSVVFAVISTRRNIMPLLAVGLVGVPVAAWGLGIADSVVAQTKLAAGLYDEARARMIMEYLGRLNGWTLFVGAPYDGSGIQTQFHGNPHNSLIRAHHIFGLPYVALVLITPLLVLAGSLEMRTRLFIAIMLALAILRGLTETILFPSVLDVFYFGAALGLGLAGPGTPLASARSRSDQVSSGLSWR